MTPEEKEVIRAIGERAIAKADYQAACDDERRARRGKGGGSDTFFLTAAAYTDLALTRKYEAETMCDDAIEKIEDIAIVRGSA